MLIRFRAKNFKSLLDEQELSFVASNAIEDNEIAISLLTEDVKLLPAAALYGANASGKTNVLGALEHMVLALRVQASGNFGRGSLSYLPFLLDNKSSKESSEFEIEFTHDGVRYRYGFSYKDSTIEEEWLYAYPKGQPQGWFHRSKNTYKFSRMLKGRNQTIADITNPSVLFLASAVVHNHKQLTDVFEWFVNYIQFSKPTNFGERMFLSMRAAQDDDLRDSIKQILALADLGISDFHVVDNTPDDEKRAFQDKIVAAFTDIFSEDEKWETSEFDELMAEVRREVQFGHKAKGASVVYLDFDRESRGTKTLFTYITPILWALDVGGLLVIDEIENSLHPVIARQLIQLFQTKETNPNGAQLLFTTHSTGLLRDNLMRRDQIWFTEKGNSGETHLYPLSDYGPRKSENLERGYLQGRYGAIPFLGNIDDAFIGRHDD